MGAGRPTKYKPEYCQAIIDWFSGETTRTGIKTITTAKGTVIQEETILPEKLPLFERFAQSIGVCVDTLDEWQNRHRKFSEAYTRAKQIQKAFLNENSLMGLYESKYAIFLAKNITDMRDRTEVEHGITDSLADTIRQARERRDAATKKD